MSAFDSPSPGGPQLSSTASIPDHRASSHDHTGESDVLHMPQIQASQWMPDAVLGASPQPQVHSPLFNISALPNMGSITPSDLQRLLQFLPICHVCNTTYDVERLHYALTMLIAALSPSPNSADAGQMGFAAQPSIDSAQLAEFGVHPDLGHGQQQLGAGSTDAQASSSGQYEWATGYPSQSSQQQYP